MKGGEVLRDGMEWREIYKLVEEVGVQVKA